MQPRARDVRTQMPALRRIAEAGARENPRLPSRRSDLVWLVKRIARPRTAAGRRHIFGWEARR
jgi:hypothetical protein